jgi:hypothetical protein
MAAGNCGAGHFEAYGHGRRSGLFNCMNVPRYGTLRHVVAKLERALEYAMRGSKDEVAPRGPEVPARYRLQERTGLA